MWYRSIPADDRKDEFVCFRFPARSESSHMTTQRKLTELEGCVLGLVWANGPCTPYTLRKEFLNSPSPDWSGSAGAIYPLIERLEKRKLIRSAQHADGLRLSKRYELTASGLSKLRLWAGPPLTQDLLGVPADP